MITTTYPQNIVKKFNKTVFSFYIIQGNEIILIQESINKICKITKKKKTERIEINIKNENNWKKLFHLYSKNDIFTSKKIFIIHLSNKNENKVKEIELINHLFYITLQKKNPLIIHFENSSYFKKIQKKINYFGLKGLIIICTINNFLLEKWFENRITELHLKIDDKAKKLLLNFYEGNIFFLSNIIKILFLTNPKKLINKKIALSLINDEGIFNAYQWCLSVLSNNKKKSIRILNKFEQNNYQPIILIRILQKYLFNMIENHDLKNKEIYFFCKITQKKINHKKYYKIIRKLTKLEINCKKNEKKLIWIDFKNLSLSFS
ncbi:MAG TPA: DNA polymerase III subunit delta [Buchnera sp. (in: enterobacteria)]|nr:DNA polymerase III subunit delta [Buchnera sp. (in: enterobacteria)]